MNKHQQLPGNSGKEIVRFTVNTDRFPKSNSPGSIKTGGRRGLSFLSSSNERWADVYGLANL
jgi:hypothetical protein